MTVSQCGHFIDSTTTLRAVEQPIMPVNRPEDKGERLSRLQRLQQRHREIGKILRDAISDDVDDGFDASTHTIGEHHLAAPSSSSGKQPDHHHHASEPIEDIVTGDEFNDQLATGAAPTSVASARSESYNGSSRPPSAGPMPMIGGSFRSAVHDDGARPATVDMSPVKQNARRSSISAAAASITSNPLVASHPEEQFLERQLGRTLVPTRHSNNSNTATSTRQKYDVPVEGGAHPAATAASSQHGGGRTPQQLAADETTPLSTPRQNRRVEEEEGHHQHDDAHQLPSSFFF
ncbi:Hypothetical protein, putative [Bodo saltans]|uniref:Uncharacterized protein n=1 Tax=Bodo saltans TaxID=75058 RepID=A0A0S4ILD8_BODSA|nr:Hypothetical protein, putative [Bodo saltans]|eukprot:CUE68551.1 Hypothetical protein, putative [Bodo saltans]